MIYGRNNNLDQTHNVNNAQSQDSKFINGLIQTAGKINNGYQAIQGMKSSEATERAKGIAQIIKMIAAGG